MPRSVSRLVPCFVLGLALLPLLSPPPAPAQTSAWLEAAEGTAFHLEVHKPEFEYDEVSKMSTVWTLSSTLPLNERQSLCFEIPYSRFSVDGGPASTTTGNLYVGLATRNVDSDYRVLIGGRIPTASERENAAAFGYYTDTIDRAEAFLPNIASFIAGLEYRPQELRGYGIRTRLASVLWVDTENELTDGVEMWILANVQAVYSDGVVTLGTGISGRYLFSEDQGSFHDRLQHEIGIFANWRIGYWTPTVRVRIPVEEEQNAMLNPSIFLGVGLHSN